MTDAAYNDFFNRKKKETIDKLIGADVNVQVAPETRTVLSKGRKHKDNADADSDFARSREIAMKWLAAYNNDKYANHGKVVTYVESGLADEIPPPVK